MVAVVVGVFALLHASIHGNQLALGSLLAFGLVAVGVVNDILAAQGIINSAFMTPYMTMDSWYCRPPLSVDTLQGLSNNVMNLIDAFWKRPHS